MDRGDERSRAGEGEPPAGLVERAASLARAFVSTPLMAGATVVTAAALMATSRSRHAVDLISRAYSRTVLGLYGVHVEPSGLELLPDGPAVYLFNHQSHADPVSIEATLPRSIRFGAKIELFAIPIFGAGLRAAGMLPIKRDNLKEVVGVYHEAQARFAQGYSFALAPEGRRQEEAEIGAFKKGPFRFAIDAQVPLVPVVLKGTHEILAKGSLLVNARRWRRAVRLRVLPPVPTRGLGVADVERVRDEVRAMMVAAYEAL